MKRTNIFVALSCALLVLVLAGCGGSNKLQSIQLNAALINGVAPAGQAGFFTLQGNGGTIQMQAIGTYSSGKTKDLSNVVTYNVAVDPIHNVDAFGVTLLPPCAGPCLDSQHGTVEFSATGLITAIEPATCSWIDIGPLGSPAWFYSGDYVVTVSFGGVISQPVYIPVASSAGNTTYKGVQNNPTGLCGPSST